MAKSNYAVQLAAFAKKASDITDRVVRQTVIEISARIDNRSPVGDGTLWKSPPPKGYIGGRFRGNWQLGVNVPVSGEVDRIDPIGAATMAENIGRVPKAAAGHRYFLSNNLPYAQRLEDGWSTQAPAGMVGLVVLEFPQIVADVVASEKGA